MRDRLARIRDRLRERLGFALCTVGLWILFVNRRRHVASAYDRDGKLWSIVAPAWCGEDLDTAYLIRRAMSRGEQPPLPAGWRLEPREESPA